MVLTSKPEAGKDMVIGVVDAVTNFPKPEDLTGDVKSVNGVGAEIPADVYVVEDRVPLDTPQRPTDCSKEESL